MRYVNIGKSGVMGSEIAVGCMHLSELSDQEAERYVRGALELGINFFDHADIYGGGSCEEKFGRILAKNPSLREKMLVQSKCGIGKELYDYSKKHILEAVDGSLKRLHADYLDILLLHRPDALMEPAEVAEALNELRVSGKVRNFGVSNFNPMQCELLKKEYDGKIVANQLQFSLMATGMVDFGLCNNTRFEGSVNHDGMVLDYSRLHDITIQAWSPFQYGFFEGVFVDNDRFPELNLVLQKMGDRYGVSKSAVAAAWILRHPAHMQVIAGTTKLERLAEISTATTVTLERADWYELYLAAGNRLP